jgi:AraC-like DNA-binding protein
MRRHITASPDAGFHFGLVRNCSDVSLAHCGREAVYAPGQALLLNGGEPAFASTGGELDFVGMMIERSTLLELVPDAEDLVVRAFDPTRPALQLLTRYVDLVSEQGVGADGAVDRHIATTILDLVALAVGDQRDSTEIAKARGLRAARLAQIVAEIRQSFARPDLSPQILARRLGISARYLQDLLFEGGASFTERVLELRLQKARGMLTSPLNAHMKVSDIALACGFNEVSYFNRCFRRRFGASPTQYRGGGSP